MKFKEWYDEFQEMVALAGDYKGGIFQRLVAASYMTSPSFDQSAIPAFTDLARKMQRQHEFLQSRFQFTPTSDDPYKSMKDMTQQINQQKQSGVKKPNFKVFAEPPGPAGEEVKQGHPLFSNDINVMIRGVHDAIAHFAGQHPFSARGEYAAYNRHLKTLCNRDQVAGGGCLAAKALFTEVVAQTSCFYVYGDFVEQKVCILNDFNHSQVGVLDSSSPLNNFFVLENKNLLPKKDFGWVQFMHKFPKLAEELKRQESLGTSRAKLASI